MNVNIIYAKFFQVAALNYNLHIEIHKIPYREDELDYPTDIQVTHVIGSGLISIVFEGITSTGQCVVIKTKRKHIEQRIRKSLATLYWILTWMNWMYPMDWVMDSYQKIVEEFTYQLDFVKEYENHQRWYEMFKSNDHIKIPQLYPSECSEHRIVMEKLEGIPIDKLTCEQKTKCVTWLSKMVIQSLIVHGFVHADLHSGNIMFNHDHIGIIDFGYMISITKEEVDMFSHLFKDFAMENFDSAADQLMNWVSPLENILPYQMDDIKDFVVHIYQKSTDIDKTFRIHDILQIITKLRMYNLKISPTFYAMGVALTAIDSVLHHLSSSPSDFIINAIIEILSLQIENRERQENSE